MEHTGSSCSLQRCEVAPREERSQLAIACESQLPSCFIEQEIEELECQVAFVKTLGEQLGEEALQQQEQR